MQLLFLRFLFFFGKLPDEWEKDEQSQIKHNGEKFNREGVDLKVVAIPLEHFCQGTLDTGALQQSNHNNHPV